MTILLTPETIKEQGHKATEERLARVRDMGIEEERLVDSINTMRDEERAERQRIDTDTQKMRNAYAAEKCELEVVLEPLRKERKEQMKPIEKLRNDAKAIMDAALITAADLDTRERAVIQKEADLNEREAEFIEDCADHADEMDDREQALDLRERGIENADGEMKERGARLAGNWAEYHAAVDAKNAELTEREAKVAAGEEANKIRAKELQAEAELNKTDRRGIQDTYRAIEQAKIHLGIK